MRFTDFDVEYDEGGYCDFDSVTVYEDEVENPKLCGIKGTHLQFEKRNGTKTFFATKQIKIRFFSDYSETKDGWRAVFWLGE